MDMVDKAIKIANLMADSIIANNGATDRPLNDLYAVEHRQIVANNAAKAFSDELEADQELICVQECVALCIDVNLSDEHAMHKNVVIDLEQRIQKAWDDASAAYYNDERLNVHKCITRHNALKSELARLQRWV